MKTKESLTLSDIAALANVSKSTVSRALRGNPLINEKTREKIQQIAQEHNFKVNAAASNLRLQKTQTIAVIILFDPASGQAISDPFMLEMIGTIADELSSRGYDMLLTTTKNSAHNWGGYYVESKRADGLIVIGQGEHDQRVDALAKENLPVVVWGARNGNDGHCIIGSDNRQGGYQAVSHLIEQGATRIAFLGDIDHPEIRQRWLGYVQAHEEAGLTVSDALRFKTDFTSNDGYRQLQLARDADAAIDGVFAVSDTIALGALKYLTDQGIAVPAQVALVGFDNIAMAELSTPALTTVRQQTDRAGQLLVDNLLKQIDKQPPESTVLPVELVVRQSSLRQPA